MEFNQEMADTIEDVTILVAHNTDGGKIRQLTVRVVGLDVKLTDNQQQFEGLLKVLQSCKKFDVAQATMALTTDNIGEYKLWKAA